MATYFKGVLSKVEVPIFLQDFFEEIYSGRVKITITPDKIRRTVSTITLKPEKPFTIMDFSFKQGNMRTRRWADKFKKVRR